MLKTVAYKKFQGRLIFGSCWDDGCCSTMGENTKVCFCSFRRIANRRTFCWVMGIGSLFLLVCSYGEV